ncbi:hypothetical protein [Bradyrhizobium embrapense]
MGAVRNAVPAEVDGQEQQADFVIDFPAFTINGNASGRRFGTGKDSKKDVPFGRRIGVIGGPAGSS